MRNHLVLAAAAILCALGAPAIAEVTLVGHPAVPGQGGPARRLPPVQSDKLAMADNFLMLPYYEVDASNGSGSTTLFAVRNLFDDTVTLEVTFHPATGGSPVVESILLAGRATRTRNLRDVPGLPITGGTFKEGWASIVARDPGTGEIVGNTPLHGDWFIVTPGENFAIGEVMEAIDATCFLWDTRFAVAGAFDDTQIRITIPDLAAGGEIDVASVSVYDEAGNYFGDVSVSATGPVSFLYASAILDALGGGPSFGVFEWNFIEDPALVSIEVRAEGRYAAGWTPACVDGAFL